MDVRRNNRMDINGDAMINASGDAMTESLDAGDDEGDETETKRIDKPCSRVVHTLIKFLPKLPIIQWLPKYRCGTFQADLIAGVTVGLTVIPQSLALAQVADLPARYGLYSAFVGCFVYCLLGTSKDITLGPTAILSLLTATFGTAVSPVLPSGEKDPTMTIVLTFLTGVIQLVMGILKLGILVNFICNPVISAFTSAAAITIGISQVKSVLGLHNIPNNFLPMVYELCRKLPETNICDMFMGLSSLASVILLKTLRDIKWKKKNTVHITERMLHKATWLIGTSSNAIVVITAAGVAAILERYDVINTISLTARVNGYKLDPSQELIAIGASNLLGSFCSAYAVTGSFARTALNSQSGVKTPMGGIWTGGLVILALCVLTPWFYYIPKSALAAVIIAAVLQMVEFHVVIQQWRANKKDFFLHLATFASSLLVGIQYGILLGVGLSIVLLLYHIARPEVKFQQVDQVLVVTPQHGLFFPAAEYLETLTLERALSGEKTRHVVMDMGHLSELDYTGVQSMQDLMLDFTKHEMTHAMVRVKPHLIRQLKQADVKNVVVMKTVADVINEVTTRDVDLETPDGFSLLPQDSPVT